MKSPNPATPLPPTFTFGSSQVVLTAHGTNCVWPNGIYDSIVKYYSPQLSPVFTQLFIFSLQIATVLLCFKTVTIIRVSPKAQVALNDFRPVALTMLEMKVLERPSLAKVHPGYHQGKAEPPTVCLPGQVVSWSPQSLRPTSHCQLHLSLPYFYSPETLILPLSLLFTLFYLLLAPWPSSVVLRQ